MQSKVFRDFVKMSFMNSKIIIPISVLITIAIVVFSLTQNEITEKQIVSEINESSEIQNIVNKIKKDKIANDNSLQPYQPSAREWIQSGPFQIDRSQYALGEKIFININNLDENVKGEMIFTRIIDDTQIFEYKKIGFDGSKPQQNFYLGIELFEPRGICSVDQLIGNWELRFVGENKEYAYIDFKIKDEIVPGAEKRFQPVC
jgi:hypothetical protein